jgi:hypothetical protein
MTKSGAAPLTFDAVGLTSGTLRLDKVDSEVTGTSLPRMVASRTFHAPVCP